MNFFWIVLSMLIGVASHIARALRWQLQLRSLNIKPSFGCICNAIFGTYAFNLVLPRFGELWRCTYVANHEKTSFSRVFGSVIGDRFADTLTVACIFIAVFFSQMNVLRSFLNQNSGSESGIYNLLTSPWLYVAVIAVVLVVIFLYTRNNESRWATRIKDFISKMWEGFRSVTSMKKGKILFLVYTIIIWTCYLMQMYVCFFAFDWMHHMGMAQALVLFVLGSIGMAVPVQGGIGPWHAAVIFGLMFYGIGREEAGAFALVAHGAQMIVTILLGIYATIAILAERKRDNHIISEH